MSDPNVFPDEFWRPDEPRDFSDLPMTDAQVMPNPEGHPDNDDDGILGSRTW